jgi:hypothetical protein
MTSGKLHPKPDDIRKKKYASRTRKALINAGKWKGEMSEIEKQSPSERRKRLMLSKFERRD